jgi:uncharacterized protein YegP (UPF0339 family)
MAYVVYDSFDAYTYDGVTWYIKESVMHVELRKSSSKNPLNRYYYAVVGGNNQTINTSETYFSKWNALRAARKIAEAANMLIIDTTVKPYKRYGSFQ